MYYFVYYIKVLLTRRIQPNSCFKKRMQCHLFIVLNGLSGMPTADLLSQTHVKNYHNFLGVVFLSGGNPYKACQFI